MKTKEQMNSDEKEILEYGIEDGIEFALQWVLGLLEEDPHVVGVTIKSTTDRAKMVKEKIERLQGRR